MTIGRSPQRAQTSFADSKASFQYNELSLSRSSRGKVYKATLFTNEIPSHLSCERDLSSAYRLRLPEAPRRLSSSSTTIQATNASWAIRAPPPDNQPVACVHVFSARVRYRVDDIFIDISPSPGRHCQVLFRYLLKKSLYFGLQYVCKVF